ncbi:MAG: glycosyltransferase family 4 protein [Anaerolineae bacterium]|nr:glycosyltransferase family 4 protein [Anaerolineae bacterium]
MKKLRVVMVISSFFPIIGGTEKQAQALSMHLLKRGVEVCILTRQYPGLSKYQVLDGLPIYRLLVWGCNNNYISTLMFTGGVIVWLIWHARLYDVVHAHQTLSPAMAALIAKLCTRKPVLIKVAGSGAYGEIREIRRRPCLTLRRRLLRQADRFLVLNEESIQELGQLGIARHQIVRGVNGVDTQRFAFVKRKMESRSLTVVSVGRLSYEKGLDLLLLAWKEVLQLKIPGEFTLLIVGDGPERVDLEALREQLALGERVVFTGATTGIDRYLQQADIFVLPSRSEGMPNAVLEAMASGLAIAATRVGGIPYLITPDQTGLLVPPEDVAALTQALVQLLTRPNLRRRLGRTARQHVEHNYSMKIVTEHYLQLYRELSPN